MVSQSNIQHKSTLQKLRKAHYLHKLSIVKLLCDI